MNKLVNKMMPFALLPLLVGGSPAAEPQIYMKDCLFLLSDNPEEQALFLPFLPKWKTTPRCILSLYFDTAVEGDVRLRQLSTDVEVTDGTGRKLALAEVKKADVFAVDEITIGLADMPSDGQIIIKGKVRYSTSVRLEPTQTEITFHSFSEPIKLPHPEVEMSVAPLPRDEEVMKKLAAKGIPEENVHFVRFSTRNWEGHMRFDLTDKNDRTCHYVPYRIGQPMADGVRTNDFYVVTAESSIFFSAAPITKPVESSIPLDLHLTTRGKLLKGKKRPPIRLFIYPLDSSSTDDES